ncbi:unnamed protein product [Mytilus coruscus]|uniref:Uncharacterized protein n=1 Tax=Mytilus coruscus TaxID=42192 RepID=A0A6J8BVY3_MYTCO|nr:unnamed protein product [Mytilus coruscus]
MRGKAKKYREVEERFTTLKENLQNGTTDYIQYGDAASYILKLETSQSPGEASTRPPTPPSTDQTGQPKSTSPPTIRRHAKRKRKTNTTPMKFCTKLLASTKDLIMLIPSASTSRIVPPTSLTSTQPPSLAPSTMYAGSIFPDEHKIIKLLYVIIEGVATLNHKLTDINRRLKTLEAKQDNLHNLLQRHYALVTTSLNVKHERFL